MSLLEDIFLQDEAGEAEELERVIEGDDDDEQTRRLDNSDDNSEKEDEAEEDKRRVDPTQNKEKRVTKNPRFILNPARLTGPRGIQIIPDHFKDFKFKGKGHEKEDLDLVLKKLEHWAYRLYPKFQFEDCLKKIETLGKKRPVMVHLHKIRTDQFMSEETVVQRDSSDDDETPAVPEEDEFDKLLQQQIDIARATPAPGSVRKELRTPRVDRSPITMPKATSSPSISDEQRDRMLKNRQLAEERRLARLTQSQNSINTEIQSINEEVISKKPQILDNSDEESGNQSVNVKIHIKDTDNNENGENTSFKVTKLTEDINMEAVPKLDSKEIKQSASEEIISKKPKRSQILDSSDEESDIVSVNQSVNVEIHNNSDNSENRENSENTSLNVNKLTEDNNMEVSKFDTNVVKQTDLDNLIENNIDGNNIEINNTNNESNNDKSIEEDIMDVDFSGDF